MAETHAPAPAPDSDSGEHAGPTFQTYMFIFYALCVLTALSFIFNWAANNGYIQHMTSAALIVLVAIIKATLVAGVFMHLKFDWGKLYGIIVPVSVLGVMMIIILSIDIVVAWHQSP